MTHPTIVQENFQGQQPSTNGLSFGNFATQVCGALQMALIQAQSEIAQTGADLLESLTSEQNASYNSQTSFMLAAYNQALNAANKQQQEMTLSAASSWTGAGLAIAGFAANIHTSALSEPAKQLENTTNKLVQQQKLLSVAKEPGEASSLAAHEDGDQELEEMNAATTRGNLIKQRQSELLAEGGGSPRVLSDEEAKMFPQDNFAPKQGHYYNENPSAKELSHGATKGAHYIKGLDEEAIRQMTPADRGKLVSKLDEQIRATRTEENNHRQALQTRMQFVSQASEIAKPLGQGSFQFAQAAPAAEAKRDEAASSMASQGTNLASGVVQAFRGTVDSVAKNTDTGMGAFGRVFDGMRG